MGPCSQSVALCSLLQAMLLMLVDILAVLGLFLDSDYDMWGLWHSSEALRQCCKNCGIMAFIGGALDWRHGFFKHVAGP